MFSKAQDIVSRKINVTFDCINSFRKQGIPEDDLLIVTWKDRIKKFYKLNDILIKYSYDQEQWVNPYDEIDRENCEAAINNI